MKNWIYWNVAKPLCNWCSSPYDRRVTKKVYKSGWVDGKGQDRPFPSKKAIFIALPKNGHQSILRGLKPLEGELIVGHAAHGWVENSSRALKCKLCTPQEKWDSYFKFCFVRNPYSRAVSAWREVEENYGYSRGFKNLLIDVYNGEEDLGCGDRMINTVAKSHLKPQWEDLIDLDGNILVNYVARFEGFTKEYNFIRKVLGMREVLHSPWLNKKRDTEDRLNGGYKNFYDEECKALVKEIYRTDLEKFNYSFNT